jgi:hypothetical protein
MRNLLVLMLVVFFTLEAALARASSEMIHPWKKVTLVVAASGFGDIDVTAEGSPALIAALSVTVKGTRIVVPPRALSDLPGLALNTIQVRSEGGRDGHPWLYVVFYRTSDLPANAVEQTVHFAFQAGKFKHRTVTTKDRRSRYKSEQRSFK